MKVLRSIVIAFGILSTIQAQTVTMRVVVVDTPRTISPYVYGTNQDFSQVENVTARRLGGNRLTGYNWENNASNAGSDWYHSSDNYLTWSAGIPNENQPGIVATTFHSKAASAGAYSLVTLQMAGYVAKDKNGTVTEDQTAPSSRWVRVMFTKNAPFSLTPNLNDTVVYMDEFVHFLVHTCGHSSGTGVKGYALDNEPALWPTTHPRIHPAKTTCAEVVGKGITLSRAVKSVDSTAEIFGPVLYGFAAYRTFQDAPDWGSVKFGKPYTWFIDYYLDTLRRAEQYYGKRLLDVLDLHWYSEAKGDTRVTELTATSMKDRIARVQAPRALWDPNYKYSAIDPLKGENSWIAQYFSSYLPLIPKLLASIQQYYPGTKLAFTEFSYGGENDISGALATADVLGILGKYGIYYGAYWGLSENLSYIRAAYRMYRNYDGAYSTFGEGSLPAYTSDSVQTSVYAAVKRGTNQIHVIAINKDFSQPIPATITLENVATIQRGNVWVLDSSSTSIKNGGTLTTIVNNQFTYTLPKASICHFVLQTTSLTVEDEHPLLPQELSLGVYPNPFNTQCILRYRLPALQTATLEIFDIVGRRIRTFMLAGGTAQILWDGTDDNQRLLPSGVYLAVLRCGTAQPVVQRLVLLK